MIGLGELVGRALMAWSSRDGLRFVGAMLTSGCTIAAIYRGGQWLETYWPARRGPNRRRVRRPSA